MQRYQNKLFDDNFTKFHFNTRNLPLYTCKNIICFVNKMYNKL